MTAPRPSIARDLLEGLSNLFVGSILQTGRIFQVLGLKGKRAALRKKRRSAALDLGRAMAAAGSGDAYLRQRIETLRKTAPGPELDEELYKLGLSGMQAGVPLLDVREGNYHHAHQAYQECVALEQKHDEVAAQIWPHGPMGWLGLVANYVVLLGAIVLGLAYFAPGGMPQFLVNLVRPPATPAEDRLPEVVVSDLRIAVKDATIDRGFETIFPKTDQPPSKADSLILQITLELTNTSDAPVRYVTWRGHHSYRNSGAYVLDDKGRKQDPYVSSERQMPLGGVYDVIIPSRGSIRDVLHVTNPDPKFEFVDLFLPCVNLNPDQADADIKRMRIPRSAINKPGDKVKK
jgi:hypothetical protein